MSTPVELGSPEHAEGERRMAEQLAWVRANFRELYGQYLSKPQEENVVEFEGSVPPRGILDRCSGEPPEREWRVEGVVTVRVNVVELPSTSAPDGAKPTLTVLEEGESKDE